MGRPKRPKDVTQCAKLVGDMLTGEVPNDKEDILTPPEPVGRQRSGQARAAALTPEQRREIARKGATARWGT